MKWHSANPYPVSEGSNARRLVSCFVDAAEDSMISTFCPIGTCISSKDDTYCSLVTFMIHDSFDLDCGQYFFTSLTRLSYFARVSGKEKCSSTQLAWLQAFVGNRCRLAPYKAPPCRSTSQPTLLPDFLGYGAKPKHDASFASRTSMARSGKHTRIRMQESAFAGLSYPNKLITLNPKPEPSIQKPNTQILSPESAVGCPRSRRPKGLLGFLDSFLPTPRRRLRR